VVLPLADVIGPIAGRSSSGGPARIAGGVLLALVIGVAVCLLSLLNLIGIGAVGAVLRTGIGFLGSQPQLTGGILTVAVIAEVAVLARRATLGQGIEARPTIGGNHAVALRAGDALSEAVVYLGALLLMFWPVAFDLTTSIVGRGDARYYMWQGWRIGELIRSGDIWSMRIPDVVYPYGLNLLLNDGFIPSMVGGMWNLVASPSVSYNLALATAFGLNLWAGRRLGRTLSNRRVVWIITALAFATAPALALRMSFHLTLSFAFTSPLLLEHAIRIKRGERQVEPFRLGLLLFLAYLCSIYYLVFGGIAFVVLLFVGSRDSVGTRGSLIRAVGGGLVAASLMIPFLTPRLALDRAEDSSGGQPVLIGDATYLSADGLSIVAQPEPSTFDLPWSAAMRRDFFENAAETTVFPGFVLLLGVGMLVFTGGQFRAPVLITALVLWLLSLGPSLKVAGKFLLTDGSIGLSWLPYTLLFSVPGLGHLRSPGRAGLVLIGVLAAAFALGLTATLDRLKERRERLVILAFVGSLLATNLIIPIPTTAEGMSQETMAGLEHIAAISSPGDAVLHVPADCHSESLGIIDMQIHHQAPVVGCHASFASIPWYSDLDLYVNSRALAALRCDPEVIGPRRTEFAHDQRLTPYRTQELRENLEIGFLIVDKQQLRSPGCNSVANEVEDLSGTDVLSEDERYIVLQLSSGPKLSRRWESTGNAY
jgi:hypothetical protein